MADGDGYFDDYFALLIGNGRFPADEHRLPDLIGPVNDVNRLKEALTDPRFGLFKADNVKICQDSTEREIKDTLHELVVKMPRKSHFLLYYSGHGLEYNGKLALATSTSTKQPHTALGMSAIMDELGGLKAERRTLILDCCYAGLASDKSAGHAADTLVKDIWSGPGHIFLRASDIETAKDARPEHELSPFTETLIEGLAQAPATGQFVDLGGVYDGYMVDRLLDIAVPKGNLERYGQSIPIARRDTGAAPVEAAPTVTTHFEDLLDDDDTVEELDVSSVSIERAHEHLAALVELGERLGPPPPQRGDDGEGNPDRGVVRDARGFLYGRLREHLAALEAARVHADTGATLRRFRVSLQPSSPSVGSTDGREKVDEQATLPWEHLPLGDGRPIAWSRGVVVERSVGLEFPEPTLSTARQKVARLGVAAGHEGESAPSSQQLAWDLAELAVEELADLGVEAEETPRLWRAVSHGLSGPLPPYLLIYPVPDRRPGPQGRVLKVNVDNEPLAAEEFVERLTAAQRTGRTGPRLVVLETIAEGNSRDATRATAELAHLLACAGVGHIAFVCHPRGFAGYPLDPLDPSCARTFAAYLVHGVDQGLPVHRAFHAAVQRMTLRFSDPAGEFGVPGLYVTQYKSAPEPESGPAKNSPPAKQEAQRLEERTRPTAPDGRSPGSPLDRLPGRPPTQPPLVEDSVPTQKDDENWGGGPQ